MEERQGWWENKRMPIAGLGLVHNRLGGAGLCISALARGARSAERHARRRGPHPEERWHRRMAQSRSATMT
ncbi:hypothetical protein AAFF_G00341620 [Aldrovandia affinis]|uniref:Uncharacterized protein n=1 Tax=Aldrovandia affinis TaxID=143900 RepID=A0AAD7SKP1_9TELE|nr:hypothetical protein AAFF_G00341620 [Aldrovandia affinis]